MNRSAFVVLAGLLLLLPTLSPAQATGKVTFSQFGWTIVADPLAGLISISHEGLGTVMENVRLNLVEGRGIHPLSGWSVISSNSTRLSIRASAPTTGWQFDLEPDLLKISSTGEGATLTADVPASQERIPARLLDSQGVPVPWSGTTEVQGTYGGGITSNRSMLPSRNPECMYFRLGQVASPLFHDLFDRSSDTAIDLPEQSRMRRDPLQPDVLKLELPLHGSAAIRLMPDYFTKVLGLPQYRRFDDSEFAVAPMVWSSWTSYYENVREEDMVRNTDWIAARLLPYGFQYVELDDGYDRGKDGEHYWIENWDRSKFPHGAKWLTDYIKSKGLSPGVWLVPNAYAGAIKDHPGWYVRDKAGKPVLDYATPALDSTNPEVLEFVQHIFRKLDDMGFEYYKLDGEHAFPLYVPAVDRNELVNKNADLVANYRHRLDLIRQTIGPKRFLEACPAGTPLNGIGYVDSYFNGDDLYASWQGMYPLFSSINANAFFNHIAAYTMPGEGLELGPPMTVDEASRKRNHAVLETARSRENPVVGFGVTQAEARTLVSYISLSGVAYPLASVMPELPEDRVRLLQATMPTLPIFPVDLFSRGTEAGWQTFRLTQPDVYVHNYPELLDLKVSSIAGVYDVVALTNWRSTGVNREIDLGEKLGLDRQTEYVAFDFWNQEIIGVIGSRLSVHIDPHDTRVLSIHPLQGRPQLVGLSRHISGSFSLLHQSWNSSTNTLSGTSESVPGDPYALWIYVPEGYRLVQSKALSGQFAVPLEKQLDGSSLMIRFTGVKDPVQWEVQFEKKH